MAGGFVAGAGQEAAGLANSEIKMGQQAAFELKLQNAKLETEHQNRIAEAIQAQGAEAAKYERESKISGGVSDAASKMLGTNLGDLRTSDAGIVDALVKGKQMSEMRNRTVSPEMDEVGIPRYQVSKNLLGYEMDRKAVPDYSAKRATYDKLSTFSNILSQSKQLYDELSVHNALGTGTLFNHLPEDMVAKRNTLMALNKQLAPLEASLMEGVPGGRFSQMLGEQMAPSTMLPEHAKEVANDLFDNSQLRVYSKMKELSPVISMPVELSQKFGGLLHDQNNNIVNPHDVTIRSGKVYYAGHPDPVGDLSSPFLAVDQGHAKSFADHAAKQAVQSAGQSKFGSASDAEAWLKANP